MGKSLVSCFFDSVCYYYYYYPFNCLFSRTTPRLYQKGKTSLDLNEARDDGVLGCSGISWTICKQSAHRSRQITTQHTITQFLQAVALTDAQPTVSKHWRHWVLMFLNMWILLLLCTLPWPDYLTCLEFVKNCELSFQFSFVAAVWMAFTVCKFSELTQLSYFSLVQFSCGDVKRP